MDRKSYQDPKILSLVARSADARSTIETEFGALRQRLDVAGRLRDSLRGKPTSWLLGSTAAGLAAGILFPRFRRKSQPTPVPGKGMPLRLLGMAWTAAQPFAKVWIANQLRSWLAQRAHPIPQPSRSSQHPR